MIDLRRQTRVPCKITDLLCKMTDLLLTFSLTFLQIISPASFLPSYIVHVGMPATMNDVGMIVGMPTCTDTGTDIKQTT